MMILQTKDLTKTFAAKTAVNKINLAIQRGSLTAILGPNGAGKSTTMRMLTGLLKPTSGTITYAPKTTIGVVFQASVLDGNLTVRENLNLRAKQYHHVTADWVTTLIQDLGLTNFTDQRYQTLSGGQKRRVDIARALLNKPAILFLDEPTTGLDIQTRLAIWDLLKDLQEKRGLTIILTTHYLDETEEADEVYIVDHGQIIAEGSAQSIKQEYAKSRLTLTGKDLTLAERLGQAGLTVSTNHLEEIVIRDLTAAEVIDLLSRFKAEIEDFVYVGGSMDDAFVNLTGKEMR
ncbi:ABC transporter, ATP-binding protein-multidrug transport system [Fructobacillus pseudoficulneus]|uniref:ABC transporter, ATP-binding protein-multidrug transport system n=2 Tax=Fructobacillus pseudoficulneus TaxID=220714 RepID=A0A3F3GVG4_9LACO|nr:ABC transporter, ATP-binding protein-multidrug transport system [Fructobacillus pseudoficulneus]SEH45598.1 multidrug/hemolysin transport system ATP-binding protein [Fructobacillus pseudoficulneus]